MRPTTRLKELVAQRQALTVPGVANALFARVAEDAGFPVIYVTGAGLANMHLGAPDIGLITLTELASAVAAIADAVGRLLRDPDEAGRLRAHGRQRARLFTWKRTARLTLDSYARALE